MRKNIKSTKKEFSGILSLGSLRNREKLKSAKAGRTQEWGDGGFPGQRQELRVLCLLLLMGREWEEGHKGLQSPLGEEEKELLCHSF